MKRVTTESGSVYELDLGIFRKNLGSWERMQYAHAIDPTKVSSINSWADVAAAIDGEVAVGKRMYIGNQSIWWLSTPVISIEEIEEND